MAVFEIDAASNVPIYGQIVDKLRYAIAGRAYRPGDQLPSVRQLAIDLLVNPNTVAKAYRELERQGLTYSRKGRGIFVSNSAPEACRRTRREIVARRIASAVLEAVRSGLEPEEVRELTLEQLQKAVEQSSGEPTSPATGTEKESHE